MTEPERDSKVGVAPPPPPPAPRLVPAQQAQGERATSGGSAGKPPKRTRRPSTSTIVAVVAAVAVVAGIFLGMRALGAAQSKPVDTRLADTPAQSASGAGSSSEDKTADAAEQKAAKADIQNALDALAADEDGQFHSYVDEFVSSYDAGVTTDSYSLADLDIDADDLSPRLRSEFECTVAKVDVYNGMAWVDVDVTSKNVSGAVESFARAVAGEALKCDDEQTYKAQLRDALLSAFDKQKARTVRVLLTLERGDDGWELGQSDIETLLGAAWYS